MLFALCNQICTDFQRDSLNIAHCDLNYLCVVAIFGLDILFVQRSKEEHSEYEYGYGQPSTAGDRHLGVARWRLEGGECRLAKGEKYGPVKQCELSGGRAQGLGLSLTS